MPTKMKILDCLSGETVSHGLSVAEATDEYTRLGGDGHGYCMMVDNQTEEKKDDADGQASLF